MTKQSIRTIISIAQPWWCMLVLIGQTWLGPLSSPWQFHMHAFSWTMYLIILQVYHHTTSLLGLDGPLVVFMIFMSGDVQHMSLIKQFKTVERSLDGSLDLTEWSTWEHPDSIQAQFLWCWILQLATSHLVSCCIWQLVCNSRCIVRWFSRLTV